jgi:hypothetical protein
VVVIDLCILGNWLKILYHVLWCSSLWMSTGFWFPRQFTGPLSRLNRIILDEAHLIRSRQQRFLGICIIKGKYRWCFDRYQCQLPVYTYMTGTPIQNNLTICITAFDLPFTIDVRPVLWVDVKCPWGITLVKVAMVHKCNMGLHC